MDVDVLFRGLYIYLWLYYFNYGVVTIDTRPPVWLLLDGGGMIYLLAFALLCGVDWMEWRDETRMGLTRGEDGWDYGL